MTSCWANYHVFLAQLDGRSYRCSATLDDAAFDRLMDALCWKTIFTPAIRFSSGAYTIAAG